jgi:hypothetical protein
MCGLLRLRHLLVLGRSEVVITVMEDFHGRGGITEIPTEIARLQYLETLEMTSTKIKRLPAEIAGLKQLKTLNMSSNIGLAELPREMGSLQHLETLLIRGSNIREQAWEIIGTLKKLKTLDASQNPELSGIPRDIGELQQLKNLNVTSTRITELPKEIGKLQMLKNLDVSDNLGITELPKEIGKLLHLETLNLSSTRIKEVPREIGNLQHLQALYLNSVRTITKLPRDIAKLQHLERLHLHEVDVRNIPREIWGLKKLKSLNRVFGTLPFEAGQLSKLEGLPNCVHRAWKNSVLMSLLAGEILSFQTTHLFYGGGLVVSTKHMHIPHWIKEHFNNITSLDIRICTLEEPDLKILREMPDLWKLTLRFEGVPKKPVAISGRGFAKLSSLTIDSRVPRITFKEGAMPSLQNLTFEFQFYGGPPNADHFMGINHLVRLEEVSFLSNRWYRGDSPCISATMDVMEKEAKKHPKRIRFKFPGNSNRASQNHLLYPDTPFAMNTSLLQAICYEHLSSGLYIEQRKWHNHTQAPKIKSP